MFWEIKEEDQRIETRSKFGFDRRRRGYEKKLSKDKRDRGYFCDQNDWNEDWGACTHFVSWTRLRRACINLRATKVVSELVSKDADFHIRCISPKDAVVRKGAKRWI